MKTSKEIRISNLEKLIKQFGTINALAAAVGKSPAQISQMKNGMYFGEKSARDIEKSLGLQLGQLDNEDFEEKSNLKQLLFKIEKLFEMNELEDGEIQLLAEFRKLSNVDKKAILQLAKSLNGK